MEPAFFCSSNALTEALEGEWNYNSRSFLTSAEKEERTRLDFMEDQANAEVQEFISKDQQQALALDSDVFSVETRLTKGDAAPPPAATKDNCMTTPSNADDLSDMTGSTRESKAQAYAASATKIVAAQYVGQISTMNTDIASKDDEIARLKLQLQQLASPSKAPQAPPPPKDLPSDTETEETPPPESGAEHNLRSSEKNMETENDEGISYDESSTTNDKTCGSKRSIAEDISMTSVSNKRHAADDEKLSLPSCEDESL